MFSFFLPIALAIISFGAGILCTLIAQWYFFNAYIDTKPYVGPSKKPLLSPFVLPETILSQTSGKQSSGAVNALLQFLFQECRNTKRVRKWFRNRLSIELEELLTRTTTGKLFETIVLRDLNLGSQLPAIRSIEVRNLSVDSGTKLIDEVELALDLEYLGGFQLSIDASMRLSKMAHVSVKVEELSGLARLKFTRNPYTHWNFSFYSDPVIQLTVESQFQGRALPQINSIIASQIRKALKRKHTLPNFKIWYKPFFIKNDMETIQAGDGLEPSLGTLELTVIEATRLTETDGPIFCNLAIDQLAWIEMTQSGTASYLTVDAIISKQSNQLGISFKQEFVPDKYQVCIIIDNITNTTTDLKVGDIVILVDGKNVPSLSSLNKLVKTDKKIIFRVERKIKNFTSEKLSEEIGLRNRGTGDKTDSDSSNPPSLSDSPAKRSLASPELNKDPPRLSLPIEEPDLLQVFTTKDIPFSKVISFNETFKFQVLPDHRYINLSLWCRGNKNSLLGHISIPVSMCCPPTVGHHISTFSLLPPNPQMANSLSNDLSSHSGFEPCLCFGDILLSFSFTGSTAQIQRPVSPQPPPVTITQVASEPEEITPTFHHDFLRTHFEKIWLKDAFQCQGCSMTCHKKCVTKAQLGPGCAKSNRRHSIQPEIIMTSPEDTQGSRTFSTLIANVATRGLRRAGSATNLAPPGTDGYLAGSVSLPPSPNHSPSPSRKTSLVEEGFFNISNGNGDEIYQAIDYLLARPHDENVMDVAKASGKSLFADLPSSLRKTKINEMLAKLRSEMDQESKKYHNLIKEEQSVNDATEKAKVAFLVGKSEQKQQAVTVLMLQCCAALQDFQDSI